MTTVSGTAENPAHMRTPAVHVMSEAEAVFVGPQAHILPIYLFYMYAISVACLSLCKLEENWRTSANVGALSFAHISFVDHTSALVAH